MTSNMPPAGMLGIKKTKIGAVILPIIISVFLLSRSARGPNSPWAKAPVNIKIESTNPMPAILIPIVETASRGKKAEIPCR